VARDLSAAGVTFGVVGSVNEASDDAQFQQIGALVPFADGKGLTVSSPFHLDGETKVSPRRAPSVGQHTDEVLQEAGYSTSEIERLRALGALGQ
jgi:formyl-CoA transferase